MPAKRYASAAMLALFLATTGASPATTLGDDGASLAPVAAPTGAGSSISNGARA